MKAYHKVAIALAAVVILGAGLWLWGRYEVIKTAAIENKKTLAALYIQSRARGFIKPEDFADGDPARRRRVFQAFFDNVQSPDLFRMKVWDRNFTVIWSNLGDLIGQRFPDNHEVEEALEGKVELEMEQEEKSERVTERQFEGFSELYVPISNAKGEIVGVIEVYQPTFSLREEIRTKFLRLAALTAVISSALYAVAMLILRFLMKPA